MRKITVFSFLLSALLLQAGGVYNVMDYGAKGDGKTLDSPAINAAIEAAVADGGGQVLLPAGTFLSGSIRLKSNIELHLSPGCILLAAPAEMKAYDESEDWGDFPQYQDGGHTYFHNSLIWAEGQENNCNVTGYKCGSFLDGTYIPEKVNWVCGRFKLGTESNGGYRNITLSNSTFMYSSGLAFEEVDQGIMENITVSNITMSHVHHYPIYITTGCRNRGPKEVTRRSSARDIQISNVVADDCDSHRLEKILSSRVGALAVDASVFVHRAREVFPV